MLKIAHASIDERNSAKGGAAGDQTGKELCIRDYYDKPWDFVIRIKDKDKAKKLKRKMVNAVNNELIGYDQTQRLTFYYALKCAGWKVKNVRTPCECDCSSLVAALLNAIGIPVLPYCTTWSLRAEIMKNAECYVFDAKGFDKERLRRGDILLSEAHHVAVVVEDGNKAVW